MPDSEIKILVVDDEESIRQLMLEVIQRQGYGSLEAADAGQALEILDRNEVDLVLLDLHMPGPADGEDLLFLLRDRGDEVPIIIVSGWVDDEATVHHPDCVHAVLKKPVRVDELAETMRQVLALS
jgi:DNA-binding response OmpR family regulator